ncbi:uncharacterized protein BDR25DRAFT_355933 [Lindgomyces ingoldianus]|uniref:Uncharacterized protein n=1 Tax=Lindgomyces ingoldianus TaxID=673940 RepID=A0ACB6QTA1_9PLEO|nr:uncharacterized protein BDR25DRAFT_355933 [Lindgomyces ingoldianus]KAF2470238.1 hypothetical protein BDR25DRAFT_355933 [Lindgomyces ingoldianus]
MVFDKYDDKNAEIVVGAHGFINLIFLRSRSEDNYLNELGVAESWRQLRNPLPAALPPRRDALEGVIQGFRLLDIFENSESNFQARLWGFNGRQVLVHFDEKGLRTQEYREERRVQVVGLPAESSSHVLESAPACAVRHGDPDMQICSKNREFKKLCCYKAAYMILRRLACGATLCGLKDALILEESKEVKALEAPSTSCGLPSCHRFTPEESPRTNRFAHQRLRCVSFDEDFDDTTSGPGFDQIEDPKDIHKTPLDSLRILKPSKSKTSIAFLKPDCYSEYLSVLPASPLEPQGRNERLSPSSSRSSTSDSGVTTCGDEVYSNKPEDSETIDWDLILETPKPFNDCRLAIYLPGFPLEPVGRKNGPAGNVTYQKKPGRKQSLQSSFGRTQTDARHSADEDHGSTEEFASTEQFNALYEEAHNDPTTLNPPEHNLVSSTANPPNSISNPNLNTEHLHVATSNPKIVGNPPAAKPRP